MKLLAALGKTDESPDWMISVGERNGLERCLCLEEKSQAALKGTYVVRGGRVSFLNAELSQR